MFLVRKSQQFDLKYRFLHPGTKHRADVHKTGKAQQIALKEKKKINQFSYENLKGFFFVV